MEHPVTTSVLLCDQIIQDKLTGNKTLVGVFDQISSEKFPAIHPRMGVFLIVRYPQTKQVGVRLTIKGESIAAPLVEWEKQMSFEAGSSVHLIFNLAGLRFEAPGEYAVEVLLDGAYRFFSPFKVLLTPAVLQ